MIRVEELDKGIGLLEVKEIVAGRFVASVRRRASTRKIDAARRELLITKANQKLLVFYTRHMLADQAVYHSR